MQALTLAVGITAVFLIFFLKPWHGLAIYFTTLLMYPSYLRIPVFGFNVSAQRMVVAALLVRILMDSRLMAKFRANLLDKLVAAMFVTGFVSLSITMGFGNFAKTYSGKFMDSVLVYFVVRLVLVDKATVLKIVKVLAVVLCIAGIMGVLESITGVSVYDGLFQYCPWNIGGTDIAMYERIGFYRANGPFGVHILFGLSFVAFLPLILLLRQAGGLWRKLTYVFFVAALAGTASSFSAGPYFGAMTILLCLVLKRRREFIKPLLIGLALVVFAGQVISDRGFFYMMGRFSFNESTAWYRARLIDVAVMKLPEYAFFGYGMVEPGWGPLLDNREHTDVCNQYVLQTVYYGLGGLAIFVGILWAGLAGLIRLGRRAVEPWLKEAAWLVGTALVALIVVFFTVGVFGKFIAVFHALLGIAGCFYAPRLIARPAYSPRAVLSEAGVSRSS